MISVLGYGCTTAAGTGADALWAGLCAGSDFSGPFTAESWQQTESFSPRACRLPFSDKKLSARERLIAELMRAWREARQTFTQNQLGRAGVILASTKGFIEDFIWQPNVTAQDFLGPLVSDFSARIEIPVAQSALVSNSCSSSLSALWLGQLWLKANLVDSVIVAACDSVGPFVLQGFQSLHALSQSQCRPFSRSRDGLQLGEACAVIVLSRQDSNPSEIQLSGIGLDAEGYAVTRPAPSGASLDRAIATALSSAKSGQGVTPEFIVAHGTGTALNDEVEDQVFFSNFESQPLVSGVKWSVGHTLGASGAIDVIAACEALRRQEVFALGNTDAADANFKSQYVVKGSAGKTQMNKVLTTSLGFGGIHAACLLEKRGVS